MCVTKSSDAPPPPSCKKIHHWIRRKETFSGKLLENFSSSHTAPEGSFYTDSTQAALDGENKSGSANCTLASPHQGLGTRYNPSLRLSRQMRARPVSSTTHTLHPFTAPPKAAACAAGVVEGITHPLALPGISPPSPACLQADCFSLSCPSSKESPSFTTDMRHDTPRTMRLPGLSLSALLTLPLPTPSTACPNRHASGQPSISIHEPSQCCYAPPLLRHRQPSLHSRPPRVPPHSIRSAWRNE